MTAEVLTLRRQPSSTTEIGGDKARVAGLLPQPGGGGMTEGVRGDALLEPRPRSGAAATDLAPANRPEGGGPFFIFGDGRLWITDETGLRVLDLVPPP